MTVWDAGFAERPEDEREHAWEDPQRRRYAVGPEPGGEAAAV
jgi:hypothetical protein